VNTIHLALDRLQPINVAFYWTVTKRFLEGISNGGPIPSQGLGKTFHRVNAALVGFPYPAPERFRIAHYAECHEMS